MHICWEEQLTIMNQHLQRMPKLTSISTLHMLNDQIPTQVNSTVRSSLRFLLGLLLIYPSLETPICSNGPLFLWTTQNPSNLQRNLEFQMIRWFNILFKMNRWCLEHQDNWWFGIWRQVNTDTPQVEGYKGARDTVLWPILVVQWLQLGGTYMNKKLTFAVFAILTIGAQC